VEPSRTRDGRRGGAWIVAIVLVVVIGFAVVTGGAGWWFYWRTKDKPQLEVTTVPPDATVLIDGRPLRGRSPFLTRATRGPHTLTVERDGYVRIERSIQVSPARPDRPVRQTVVLLPAH